MNVFHQLPRARFVNDRMDFAVEACRGKRVLHVGCVDAGVLQERFETGALMHQKMAAVSVELWGADVDRPGMNFLASKGFKNLFVCNAERIGDEPGFRNRNFDLIVASEILEHLSNPGLFLESVKLLMKPERTRLLITVPNAFGLPTLFHMLRRVECVHPDHHFWFSYHTLTRLLESHGFALENLQVYGFQGRNRILRVLTSLLYRLNSFFANGIIATVLLASPSGVGQDDR